MDALQQENCFFYIHIDKKYALPVLNGDNILLINDRVNVHWGGFSQVEATLLLMREAVKKPFDYAAFISGKDYPVKPNEWLQTKLGSGGEYIHLDKMGTDPYAPLSRYKFYYFTDHYNRRNKSSVKTRFFLWFQKTLRRLKIAKTIPFQLYTGASWFVLSKNCIQYILNEIKSNPKICNFYRSAFCPDESFFQTIIGNSAYAQHIKNCLTYSDWSVDPGPAVITEDHFHVLQNLGDTFFARKFTDESQKIIQLIDKELRKVEMS